ncbi:MAG: long-chain fatty acid--CoA ligase [Acidobacteria bacterium]|nr:MAG: long-chain fatty acid--CoA ligase [Acidobacteriota bacterium]PIE89133.1 MAG: long-chain fatty acid--CoA ligase [Acidobacteriota bacterium]
MAREADELDLFARAEQFKDGHAIRDETGIYSYQQLLTASASIASSLLNGRSDLNEARISFLVSPGFHYTAVQWGIWRAGGIAVPLPVSHPPAELQYVLRDSGSESVVVDPLLIERIRLAAEACSIPVLLTTAMQQKGSLPQLDASRRAMIIYTSGTTGKPKGVVTTHAQIQAQVTSLVSSWGWVKDDVILNVLPLHHVHGVVNVLTCALWSGALCEFLPQFKAEKVWQRFQKGGITLFMAVPTIYSKLIRVWQEADQERRKRMSRCVSELRLMVSGSAALPIAVLDQWRTISGHTLLERYGMTEIGMALSNPLKGERVAGHVGKPLAGVIIRLVDEQGEPFDAFDCPGEIQVKGPCVFKEYWQKPQATRDAFQDGWFRTGDSAQKRSDGVYRILGRNSVDIIKSGGFKISALEIEDILRTHAVMVDCAVVGVEDPEWGERIAAACVIEPGKQLTLQELKSWAKERLAPYKVPTLLRVLRALPKNAMGKTVKQEVKELFRKSV